MKKNSLLSAGALPFVLQLSLLFMVLLSGFIAWVYMLSLIKQKSQGEIQKEAAIRTELISFVNHKNGKKAESFQTVHYGFFELVKTFKGSLSTVALVGPSSFSSPPPSLYLPNSGNSLYIAETVTLKGNLHLSPAGIRSTHLTKDPNSIKGTRQYQLFESNFDLPQINTTTYNNLNKIIDTNLWTETAFPLEENIIKQSFFDPLHIAELDQPFRLEVVQYIGNIWLRSTEAIYISAEAKLYDIILSAPEIYIEAGFQGRIQAYASKSIRIGDNCLLQYPSVIWVNQINSSQDNSPAISIGERSTIQGFLGYTKRDVQLNPNIQMVLGEKSKIRGSIYCQAMLQSAADITGTVYAQDIGVHHEGTVYQHHILSGSIQAEQSPNPSTELPFFSTNHKKVMQWLY